jgi:hypothetical protein
MGFIRLLLGVKKGGIAVYLLEQFSKLIDRHHRNMLVPCQLRSDLSRIFRAPRNQYAFFTGMTVGMGRVRRERKRRTRGLSSEKQNDQK